MQRDDLAGLKFGRLTVLEFHGKNKFGVLYWLCRCECGVEKPIRGNNLRGGITTSCSCTGRNYQHGMTGTRTFKSWDSMRQRCQNPNDTSFARYGGRGIKVCDRWESFENFLADMGERPEGTSLDRIDNGKDYQPSNCRWATATEQQANRSTTSFITANGQTKPLQTWARELGVPSTTLVSRIAKGWPPDEVVNRPVRPKRPAKTKHSEGRR